MPDAMKHPDDGEGETFVYAVVGQVGEYSDRKVWTCRVLSTEREAREFCEIASAVARERQSAHALAMDGPGWPDPQDFMPGTDPVMPVEVIEFFDDGVLYHVERVPFGSPPTTPHGIHTSV
jgi:hypothetical protein